MITYRIDPAELERVTRSQARAPGTWNDLYHPMGQAQRRRARLPVRWWRCTSVSPNRPRRFVICVLGSIPKLRSGGRLRRQLTEAQLTALLTDQRQSTPPTSR